MFLFYNHPKLISNILHKLPGLKILKLVIQYNNNNDNILLFLTENNLNFKNNIEKKCFIKLRYLSTSSSLTEMYLDHDFKIQVLKL